MGHSKKCVFDGDSNLLCTFYWKFLCAKYLKCYARVVWKCPLLFINCNQKWNLSTNLGRHITQHFLVSCRCVDLYSCSCFVSCGKVGRQAWRKYWAYFCNFRCESTLFYSCRLFVYALWLMCNNRQAFDRCKPSIASVIARLTSVLFSNPILKNE